jgi:hypothetical protein
MGGIFQSGEAGKCRFEPAALAGGQAVAVVLDAEARPFQAQFIEDGSEVFRGVGIGAVDPDADVADNRGEGSLALVGGAG